MTIHSHATSTAGGVATYTTTTTYITTTEDTRTAMVNRIFYVSSAGNDAWDGLTTATPWQTIAKVNAAALVPGDQVLFKRGETWVGELIPATSGDANRYILYGAYGTGARPIIDGSAQAHGALYIGNSTYHHLRYESIDFSGCGLTHDGVVDAWSHDLYFYDCVMRDAADGYGYSTWSTTGASTYNITLDSCVIHDNYMSGLYAGSSTGEFGPYNILITNCISHDNGNEVDPTAHHGFYVKFGCIVEHCIAYDNSGGGFKVNSQFVLGSTFNPIIRYNEAYGNRYGVYLGEDLATINNNLLYSNINGIVMDGDCHNSKVYFNTIVNGTGMGIGFDGDHCPGNDIRNNVIIQDAAVQPHYMLASMLGSSLDQFQADGNVIDYNVYYYNGVTTAHSMYDDASSSGKDWLEWRALSQSPDAHSVYLSSVPDFVARYTDLHPANGGNLKALGLCMLGYQVDKDGGTKAEPPTPGCYEDAS